MIIDIRTADEKLFAREMKRLKEVDNLKREIENATDPYLINMLDTLLKARSKPIDTTPIKHNAINMGDYVDVWGMN